MRLQKSFLAAAALLVAAVPSRAATYNVPVPDLATAPYALAAGDILNIDSTGSDPEFGLNVLGLITSAAGEGVINVSGDNFAALTNAGNNFNGTVNVLSGGLVISADGGSAFSATVSSGGTFGLNGGITLASTNLTIAGSGPAGSGVPSALYNVSGANVVNNVTLSAAATILIDGTSLTVNALDLDDQDLTISGDGNFTVTTATSNAANITKDGLGSALLGSLTLTAATDLIVNSGTLGFSALDQAGFDLGLYGAGTLSVTATSANGAITKDGDGTANLGDVTLTGDTTLTVNAGTVSADSLTGAFNLTKAGAGAASLGVFTLDAAKTLAVDAGVATLGDLTLSSASITVASGATLELGSGVADSDTADLGGTVTISGTGDATKLGAIHNLFNEVSVDTLQLGDDATIYMGVEDDDINVTNLKLEGFTLTLDGVGQLTATTTTSTGAVNVIMNGSMAGEVCNLGDITLNGASVLTVNGLADLEANVLDLNGFALTLEGAGNFVADSIIGAGNITKNGTGSGNLGYFDLVATTTLTANEGSLNSDGLVQDGNELNLAGAGNFDFTYTDSDANITKDGAGTANLGDVTLYADVAFTVNAGELKAADLTLDGWTLDLTAPAAFTVTGTTYADANITIHDTGAPVDGSGVTLGNLVLWADVELDLDNALVRAKTTTGAFNLTVKGLGFADLGNFGLDAANTLALQDTVLALVGAGSSSSATITVADGSTFALYSGAGSLDGYTPASTGTGAASLTGALSIAGAGFGAGEGALMNFGGDNTVTGVNQTADSGIGVVAGSLGVTTLDLGSFAFNVSVDDGATFTATTTNGAANITKTGAGIANLGALTLGANAAFTVDGGELKAGSLVQSDKTLEIAGTNNFTVTGATTADANITVSGTGTANFGAVTLTDAIDLTVSGTGNFVATSTTGDFNLTKKDTGTAELGNFSLGAAQTLDIQGGVAEVGNGTSSDAAVTIGTGATLALDSGIAGTASLGSTLTISGAGATGQGGAIVSVSGANTVTGITQAAAATAAVTAGSLDVTTLDLASFAFDVSVGDGATFDATTTNGAASITKTGAGTADLGALTLADNAVFTVDGGELKAGSLVQSDKTLEIAGTNNFTVTGATTADANITVSGTGTANFGAVTLADAIDLTVTGTGNFVATSTTGAFNLTKKGSGIAELGNFSLGAAQTLDIQDGVAEVNNGTVSAANVTIADGATLSLDSGIGGTATLSGALTISGIGETGQGGAIVSVVGTNTVGNVTQAAASTIKVSADSLTAGDLNGAFTLTLDVVDAAATFTAGKTGSVPSITKSGSGTAKLGTVQDALETVTVDGGVLEFRGTDSSSAARHSTLNKWGSSELRFDNNTTYYYGTTAPLGVTLHAGTTTVKAGSTLNSFVTVAAGAVFDVELGAFHVGDLVSESSITSEVTGLQTGNVTLNADSDYVITSTGTLNGNATLNDISVLTVDLGGELNGNITANDDSDVTIEGTTTGDTIAASGTSSVTILSGGVAQGDTQGVELTLSNSAILDLQDGGTLLGNVTARNTSDVTVSGSLTGAIDVTGDADLGISSTGEVNGEVTITGDNQVDGDSTLAVIDGTLNGNLTLTNDASLLVLADGVINGNLTARNTSLSSIAGELTGDLALSSSAQLTLDGGTIVGNASITQSSTLTLDGVFLGDIAAKNTTQTRLFDDADVTGDIDLTQSAELTTDDGSAILGELVAQNDATATLGGALTGDISLSDTADLTVTATGSVTGNLGMVDASTAAINGAGIGNVTASDNAQLSVGATGALIGDLDLSDSADASVAGTTSGDAVLANDSSLTVSGTLSGDSLSASGTSDITVSGTIDGLLAASNVTTLVDSTTLTVTATGSFTSSLSATDGSTASISGNADGAVTLGDSASLTIFAGGNLDGAVTAANGSSLSVVAGGTLDGSITASDNVFAQVDGSAAGNVTLSDNSFLAVNGDLTGNLTASDNAITGLSGDLDGDVILGDNSIINVSATGTLTGDVTASGVFRGALSLSGVLNGDASFSGASLGLVNVGGVVNGAAFSAIGTSQVSISGTVQGVAGGANSTTIGGDADVSVNVGGLLKSSVSANDTSNLAVYGTSTGPVELNDTATLNVSATGTLNGDLDGNEGSNASIAGALNGDITLSGTAVTTVSGTAIGTATLSGEGDLTVTSTGTLTGDLAASGDSYASIEGDHFGAITMANDSMVDIDGQSTGPATLTGNSELNVFTGATLDGNLTGSDDAVVNIAGDLIGTITLDDDAVTTVSGSAIGAATLTGGSDLDVTGTGAFDGDIDASGTGTTVTIDGTADGDTTLSAKASLDVSGDLTGDLDADDSTATVSGDLTGAVTLTTGSDLSVSGTLDGAIDADASTATISGTATGAVTLTGSDLDVTATGDLTGAIDADASTATVSGASTGAVTLTGGSDLSVSGTLDGSIDADDSDATVSGTATGAVTLTTGSNLDVTATGDLTGAIDADDSTATISGASTGAVTLTGGSDLSVSGTLDGAIDASDTSAATVTGTATGDATLADDATLSVSGTLTGDLTAANGSTTTVSGALTGSFDLDDVAEATVSGTLTGSGSLATNSLLTVSAGGAVKGATLVASGTSAIVVNGTSSISGLGAGSNAITLDDNATLDLAAATGTIKATLTANDSSVATLQGTLTGNVGINDSALLDGNGTIVGNVTQTGGTVAPGNSPGVTTVVGNYAASAGTLQIELAGNGGVAGTDFDQLDVSGTVTLSGTADLEIASFGGFEASRAQVFQAITSSDGNATRGTFATLTLSAAKRVLFDHSSGKAYGTGLTGAQTFASYATTANQQALAAALYGEAVVNDSFILTTGGAGVQQATDLGSAAVALLTSSDTALALDALSPEAFAGIAELGARSARNFAKLPITKRRQGKDNEWDFSVGYAGERITSNAASSSYANYELSSDEFSVTAARDLAPDARLTLAVGDISGKVGATGFQADTDTQAFGAGLTLRPSGSNYTVDLGIAALRTDWDASRGGAQTSSDGQDGLGLSLRLTRAATVDGALSYSPYVGISYANQQQAAVSENAASAGAGVGFAGYERKSAVGELGLQAEYAVTPATTLTGVVAWEHEFKGKGETVLDAEFTEDGAVDSRFAVRSAGLGNEMFRLGVGLRTGLGANSSFSLSYDALISSRSESGQAVRADVSFRF